MSAVPSVTDAVLSVQLHREERGRPHVEAVSFPEDDDASNPLLPVRGAFLGAGFHTRFLSKSIPQGLHGRPRTPHFHHDEYSDAEHLDLSE